MLGYLKDHLSWINLLRWLLQTSITLFVYFYFFSCFQNGVKTTSLADATYGNQEDSATQPFHAWKIWWRSCVTRHATSVVRFFYTKSSLCLIKKLRNYIVFISRVPLTNNSLFLEPPAPEKCYDYRKEEVSVHGCCWDGIIAATGPGGQGCPGNLVVCDYLN